MRRYIKIAAIVVIVLLVVAVAGFVVWAQTPLGPDDVALAALESDDAVQVETEPWYIFRPTNSTHTTGLILYPGGRVDPRSYAPQARAIAEAGYPVVLVPMPLNLAVFGVGKAGDVMVAFPEIETWAIGGHSLGGAMGASYTYDNPGAVEGLVLWASYPAGSADLSTRADLAVSSIFGTNDQVASSENMEGSRALLPADTVWVPIEGGNHAQFGWYGPQPGDGQATISPEEQQAQTVAATVELLQELDTGN